MVTVEKEFYSRYRFSELEDMPQIDFLSADTYALRFYATDKRENINEHHSVKIIIDKDNLKHLYYLLNDVFKDE